MSIELEQKCDKYKVSNSGRQMIRNLEKMFDINAKKQLNEEDRISMCKYIEGCTDFLVGFSEEQRFFFGVGVITDDVATQYGLKDLEGDNINEL